MASMSIKSGPGAWLVYLGVRAAFAVMQTFPIDRNLRTARSLAYVWRWVMPRHFDRAADHLRAAYGDALSHTEVRRLAMRCLQSVVMFAVEVVCLPRLLRPNTWPRYIRPVDFSEALDVLLSGTGAILVTGHYGSFEVLGHLLSVLGFDVRAVMRPLDNVYLNRFIVSSRRSRGLRLLDKKGAMTAAADLLRGGALLAFIGDQDAGRKGIFVDFFDRPASAYKSIGLLAMTARVPIIVGYARRRSDVARYDVGVQRIIHPSEWEARADPLRFITQAYSSAIEATVRADPEQYLWIHRRWKSQPRARRSDEPTSARAAHPRDASTITGSRTLATPSSSEIPARPA